MKKYKKFLKIRFFFKTFLKEHSRILKFKRSKWKFLKAKILSKRFRWSKNALFNSFRYSINNRRLIKLKSSYRASLLLKRSLFHFFGTLCSVKGMKKNFQTNILYKTALINCLIKPLFNINIILWKLGLTNSYAEINQLILFGKIKLNCESVFTNRPVKDGDVIDYSLLVGTVHPNLILNSFLEIDLYSKKIYIVKNVASMTLDDLYLLVRDKFNLKLFKDYIRLK